MIHNPTMMLNSFMSRFSLWRSIPNTVTWSIRKMFGTRSHLKETFLLDPFTVPRVRVGLDNFQVMLGEAPHRRRFIKP
jgi:hypothetical protein